MTTLQINSSLFGPGGQSTTLANELVTRLGGKVIVRDLAKNPVPHLDGERFAAFLSRPEARTPAQQAIVDTADIDKPDCPPVGVTIPADLETAVNWIADDEDGIRVEIINPDDPD